MENFRAERGKILDRMDELFAEIDKLKENGIENIDKEAFFKCRREITEGFFAIWKIEIREMEQNGANIEGIEQSKEKYRWYREEYEKKKKNGLL